MVDLKSIPTTVSIGGFDYSPTFSEYTISTPKWSRDGLCSATGTLTLTPYSAGFPESLHPWENPGRFFRGQSVVISHTINSTQVTLPWKLSILEVRSMPAPSILAQPDPLVLSIGDDLTLKKELQPEGTADNSSFGTFQQRDVHINRILDKVDLVLTDEISDYPLRFSPQKAGSGSWIRVAGELAYTANHILWQQADGAIRATRFDDFNSLSPLQVFEVFTDEVDFQFTSAGEPASNIFEVSGSSTTLEDIDDYNNTSDIYDNGVLVGRIITRSSNRGSNFPSYIKEQQAQASKVLEDEAAGNSLILDRRETLTENYNGVTGELQSTTLLVEEALGKVIPEGKWTSPGVEISSSQVTTQYEYDLRPQQVRKRTARTEEPSYLVDFVAHPLHTGNPLALSTAVLLIDEWDGKEGDTSHTQSGFSRRLDDKGNSSSQATGAIVQRPAVKFREPRFTRETTTYTDSVQLDNPVTGQYQPDPKPIRMPEDMVTSKDQCRALAQVEGTLQYGRSRGCESVTDISLNWLQNWSPVRRMDWIDWNRTRRSYLVDGFVISVDTRSAAVDADGAQLAVIGTVGAGSATDPDDLITALPFIEAFRLQGGGVGGGRLRLSEVDIRLRGGGTGGGRLFLAEPADTTPFTLRGGGVGGGRLILVAPPTILRGGGVGGGRLSLQREPFTLRGGGVGGGRLSLQGESFVLRGGGVGGARVRLSDPAFRLRGGGVGGGRLTLGDTGVRTTHTGGFGIGS